MILHFLNYNISPCTSVLLLRSALYYIPYLTFLQEKNELKKNPSATHHIGGQNFTEWWSPYMFLENIVGGAAAAQPCMILEFFWTFGYFRYKFFFVCSFKST